jgi:cell division protein FtsW
MNHEESKKYLYFLVLVLALVCVGLVMVYSASHPIAAQKFHDPSHYLKNHFIRIVLGSLLFALGAAMPYRKWAQLGRLGILASFVLLLLVLIPGPQRVTLNQATRWLHVGPFQFQPVDFVRLLVIFYLADVLTRKEDLLNRFKEGVLPQLLVLGLIAGLVLLQPDLGSALMLLVVAGVLLVTGGVPLKFFSPILIAAPFSVLFLHNYQRLRLLKYVDSVFHGEPVSYQVGQSLVGLGKGGLLGVGLDNSIQKLHFLPEPFSDFVFSILGEEFGFLGTFLVLTAILAVVLFGYRTAQRAKSKEGLLMAVGITTTIALYAFVNAGVVTSLLPTKGLPMPFISYGGSFQISVLWGVGILYNIMREGIPEERVPVVAQQSRKSRAAWVQS